MELTIETFGRACTQADIEGAINRHRAEILDECGILDDLARTGGFARVIAGAQYIPSKIDHSRGTIERYSLIVSVLVDDSKLGNQSASKPADMSLLVDLDRAIDKLLKTVAVQYEIDNHFGAELRESTRVGLVTDIVARAEFDKSKGLVEWTMVYEEIFDSALEFGLNDNPTKYIFKDS